MEPEASVPALGIENVKEAALAGIKLYEALAQAQRDDGKINLADLPKILPLLPSLVKAVDGGEKIVPELKDLSSEEAAELVAYVSGELGLVVDEALKNKIEKVLLAAKANYDAVKAFV